MEIQTIKDVQKKILEIMIFIDRICRENDINYYIMGGTALGAVRHGGFIPWDDDLDIFMTPHNYQKFKNIMKKIDNNTFILQEWKIVDEYLEYAKVRMNGTTFIESNFKAFKNMHHGIYVDIMILHKVPNNKFLQKIIYYQSKFVTLVALSKRNWTPKNKNQKLCLKLLNVLPNKILCKQFYKHIYSYNNLNEGYKFAYYITKANFKQGIFSEKIFDIPKEIKFENHIFMGPSEIEEYLAIRYGDYRKLPPESEQKIAIHAEIYDTKKDYKNYI